MRTYAHKYKHKHTQKKKAGAQTHVVPAMRVGGLAKPRRVQVGAGHPHVDPLVEVPNTFASVFIQDLIEGFSVVRAVEVANGARGDSKCTHEGGQSGREDPALAVFDRGVAVLLPRVHQLLGAGPETGLLAVGVLWKASGEQAECVRRN